MSDWSFRNAWSSQSGLANAEVPIAAQTAGVVWELSVDAGTVLSELHLVLPAGLGPDATLSLGTVEEPGLLLSLSAAEGGRFSAPAPWRAETATTVLLCVSAVVAPGMVSLYFTRRN